jgi:hypothetical protein
MNDDDQPLWTPQWKPARPGHGDKPSSPSWQFGYPSPSRRRSTRCPCNPCSGPESQRPAAVKDGQFGGEQEISGRQFDWVPTHARLYAPETAGTYTYEEDVGFCRVRNPHLAAVQGVVRAVLALLGGRLERKGVRARRRLGQAERAQLRVRVVRSCNTRQTVA